MALVYYHNLLFSSIDLFSICYFIFIQFLYRVGENGEWDQVPQIQTKSNVTSYQVTGLVPFTVYSFRLKAVNKLGISLPSKESYYIVTLREGKYWQEKKNLVCCPTTIFHFKINSFL